MWCQGPPTRTLILLLLALVVILDGCGTGSGGDSREPRDPIGLDDGFHVIVHTIDGRHLRFAEGLFEPSAIEHCREDGKRHLTTIYELRALYPGGKVARSLCPDLSGQFMTFRLVFPDEPQLKVTSICPDGCVVPGGYYPPLAMDVRIPWSEIIYIEFRD